MFSSEIIFLVTRAMRTGKHRKFRIIYLVFVSDFYYNGNTFSVALNIHCNRPAISGM